MNESILPLFSLKYNNESQSVRKYTPKQYADYIEDTCIYERKTILSSEITPHSDFPKDPFEINRTYPYKLI